jgi:hypothetical protein
MMPVPKPALECPRATEIRLLLSAAAVASYCCLLLLLLFLLLLLLLLPMMLHDCDNDTALAPEPVAAAVELCPEPEMGAGSLSGTFEAQPTRVTMKAIERRTEIR